MVSTAMAIPLKYQHRVVVWGIFGALFAAVDLRAGGGDRLQRAKARQLGVTGRELSEKH